MHIIVEIRKKKEDKFVLHFPHLPYLIISHQFRPFSPMPCRAIYGVWSIGPSNSISISIIWLSQCTQFFFLLLLPSLVFFYSLLFYTAPHDTERGTKMKMFRIGGWAKAEMRNNYNNNNSKSRTAHLWMRETDWVKMKTKTVFFFFCFLILTTIDDAMNYYYFFCLL